MRRDRAAGPGHATARPAPVRLGVWWAAGVAGVLGYVGWFAAALADGDYNTWGTLLVAPALVLISVPMLRRAVAREPDAIVRVTIVAAFGVKLAMAFVNHAVAFGLYGGVADARGYHGAGAAYSAAFRSGHLGLAEGGELGRRFVNALTGVVYTVTGPTKLGGYLVFSWIAFWGLYLFYRAFVLAVPDGDHRRCALLVFLLPSTLFWTSAIGKEAWMILALGVCSLGAARLVTSRRGGLALVALGLAGASLCRPHISVMVVIAILVAFLLRRPAGPRRPLAPLSTLASIAVLVTIGAMVANQFTRHFEVGPGSVGTVLQTAQRQTEAGRSAFSTEGLPRPLAAAGVLFRPFPHEAENLPSLLTAGEGLIMLGLLVLGRRRLRTTVRRMLTTPFLVFCVAYTAMFLFAFSAFSNFGTLARERVQVAPFVLALLSLPAAPRLGDRRSVGPRYGAPAASDPTLSPSSVSRTRRVSAMHSRAERRS